MDKRKVKITEKAIQQEIAWRLRMKGWLCLRLPPSIYSNKGIPDLLALKKKDYLLIEVKSDKGKLSPKQLYFKTIAEANDVNYIIARSWQDVENYIIQRRLHEEKT